MFQRIKASIDSALEQEQAKARAVHRSPSRSGPGARRVASRAISPTKGGSRQGSRNRQDSLSRRTDPIDFEGDFAIEDEELSRSGTPKAATDADGQETGAQKNVRTPSLENGDVSQSREEDSTSSTPEFPTEVRVKLRKLEKLEGRYQDLLRSYRIAHARVQSIDTFERSLRENTPLTSISDPKALVEYLNQLNLKGDLVLEELKRVSNERDTFKQRLDEAEKRTREAYDEAARLRLDKSTDDTFEPIDDEKRDVASQNEVEKQDRTEGDLSGVTRKSPPPTIKSPTISIPKMSLFSPKLNSLTSPKSRQGSEDLFSYDDEIPKLESEVHARQEKIDALELYVQKLKTDLAVTRESTQSMVQTLEEATREVNTLRDSKERFEADARERQDAYERTTDRLREDLQTAESKLQELEQTSNTDASEQITKLRQDLESARLELSSLHDSKYQLDANFKEMSNLHQTISTLEAQLSTSRKNYEETRKHGDQAEKILETFRQQLSEAEAKNAELTSTKQFSTSDQTSKEATVIAKAFAPDGAAETQDPPATSKKNKKKKKKGTKSGSHEVGEAAESTTAIEKSTAARAPSIDKLQDDINHLKALVQEKDKALAGIQTKLKDQEGLQEEIETLRDDLVNVGQEHVEARDKVKQLTAEKQQLDETVSKLEKDLADARTAQNDASTNSEGRHIDLSSQFEELKVKASSLQTDLAAAEQLASSRYKDLDNLRSTLQKAQPEISALRGEAAEAKSTKEALIKKDAEFKRLDSRHEEMRSEVAKLRHTMTSREAEIKTLNQLNAQEAKSRSTAEDSNNKAQLDINQLEIEKRQAEESVERIAKELAKIREELATHKSRLRDVEQQYANHRSDSEGLKEEMELKSAQYASAQSLMSSMRDQTAEMATQLKEARDRCESLDEEVAEAHRLLNERGREGETMRRLLADVEGRADVRVREMKDRMDTAIEERDRVEEEASTSTRRRARELEDMRNKYRDLERSLKRAEEDKDELEFAQRDWKKRREELELRAEQSSHEVEEIRKAMADLRDALDESERQAREVEKQKAELRRSVEETQHRIEKMQKSNKSMAEEIAKIRESRKALESESHSSRTSTDSPGRLASPAPLNRSSAGNRVNGANGQSGGVVDHAYLKNVLLQFLEQKDKKYQMQLLPVLGMLLQFDKKDEQKWMSAITTKS